jgi:uncharacterized RDD family membrane protein YckC
MSNIEDKISIQTTQYIDLEQSYASIGERIVASLIDYAVYLGILFTVIIIALAVNKPVIILITLIPLSFYTLALELMTNGQSIGKRIMKLKIVKTDGSSPNFLAYLIRWIFRLIDVVPFGSIATLTIILNNKGQRLGDIAAGTAVIRLKKNIQLQSLTINLPSDYKPVFHEAMNLDDHDIKILNEAIECWYERNDVSAAAKILTAARGAFEKKLNIQSTQNHIDFLTTLQKDYYYFHK